MHVSRNDAFRLPLRMNFEHHAGFRLSERLLGPFEHEPFRPLDVDLQQGRAERRCSHQFVDAHGANTVAVRAAGWPASPYGNVSCATPPLPAADGRTKKPTCGNNAANSRTMRCNFGSARGSGSSRRKWSPTFAFGARSAPYHPS